MSERKIERQKVRATVKNNKQMAAAWEAYQKKKYGANYYKVQTNNKRVHTSEFNPELYMKTEKKTDKVSFVGNVKSAIRKSLNQNQDKK